MVVPLGPGKFYGKSLPRPRIYTDVKFADERVDPPPPLMDPLLSWAAEAHWSMGGLSFKRLRLQGRIEGSVSKLRAGRERKDSDGGDVKAGASVARSVFDSPPPAPVARKRRPFMDLIAEEEEEEEVEEEEERKGRVRRRRLVKKLGDDFDRVAAESGEKAGRNTAVEGGSRKTRRQILEDVEEEEEEVVVEKVNKVRAKGKMVKSESGSGASRLRSSPRLAQRA